MSLFKEKGFGERLSAAAHAKKAALQRFRARPAADDPAVVERQTARQAISDAREDRVVSRTAARLAGEAREAADREERAARDKRETAEKADREAALEADRKAARDARYAARKARK